MVENERLICPSSALVDGGSGFRFSVPYCGRDEPAFAIRYQGIVHAYLNRCAHVPIELDWQNGQFFDHSKLYLICATHGALYAPDTGRCVLGRCDRKGLRPLRVVEHNDFVYLISSE